MPNLVRFFSALKESTGGTIFVLLSLLLSTFSTKMFIDQMRLFSLFSFLWSISPTLFLCSTTSSNEKHLFCSSTVKLNQNGLIHSFLCEIWYVELNYHFPTNGFSYLQKLFEVLAWWVIIFPWYAHGSLFLKIFNPADVALRCIFDKNWSLI